MTVSDLRAEFAEAHEHVMGAGHGDMEHPGMAGGHEDGDMSHMGHGGERAGLVMLILLRADPGHTGVVTRDAFVRAALSLFDQADTNHDGILTSRGTSGLCSGDAPRYARKVATP